MTKGTVLLFLGGAFASSVLGQEPPMPDKPLFGGCRRDSTITYDGEGTKFAKRLFHYNNQNLLDTVWLYTYSGNYLILEAITSYEYDVNGNTISILKESPMSDDCHNSEYSVFTYDYENKMQSNIYYKGDGGNLYTHSEIHYKYDYTGNLIEILTHPKGINSIGSTKTMHFYDSLGILSNSINFRMDLDGNWEEDHMKKYTYNEIGNLTEQTSQLGRKDSWRNYWKKVCRYIDSGATVEEVTYHWKDPNWIEQTHCSTSYDSQKNPYRRVERRINLAGIMEVRWTVDRFFNCNEKRQSASTELVLWPNPTTQWLNLEANNDLVYKTVSVYNAFGIQVHDQEFNPSLNVEKLVPGSYVIRAIGNGFFHQAKFIKL